LKGKKPEKELNPEIEGAPGKEVALANLARTTLREKATSKTLRSRRQGQVFWRDVAEERKGLLRASRASHREATKEVYTVPCGQRKSRGTTYWIYKKISKKRAEG